VLFLPALPPRQRLQLHDAADEAALTDRAAPLARVLGLAGRRTPRGNWPWGAQEHLGWMQLPVWNLSLLRQTDEYTADSIL